MKLFLIIRMQLLCLESWIESNLRDTVNKKTHPDFLAHSIRFGLKHERYSEKATPYRSYG